MLRGIWGFMALAAVAFFGRPAFAQSFRILEADLDISRRPILRIESLADSYYILFRGTSVTAVNTPAALALGSGSAITLSDPSPLSPGAAGSSGGRFYRAQRVPLTAPRDTDNDGIDDVFELRHPAILNPTDPADATRDGDADGRSNLEEYRDGTDPESGVALTRVASSSPANEDNDVAVTRETIIYFTAPLATDAMVDGTTFYAQAGGKPIQARREISSDRLKVSLFYQEPLPGNTRVVVTLVTDNLRDARGLLIDGDGDGTPGGQHVMAFDTVSLTPLTQTAVVGRVFASELGTGTDGLPINRPLKGVIITVDGREETLRAVTDADGRFTLSPSPSGTFFVHIDGRPADGSTWPNGSYYPFVGKSWTALAGRQDNLAGETGEIFLPLIVPGTLQPVSTTADTPITFPTEVLAKNPELTGVQIDVPANSLFADDGRRGGRVGIAPVPSDRLPGPLPPGLSLPLVITVQTDGPSNFDRPVPVRFPNLPDPQTGLKLPPGAKSALWSFNHDTGEWEIVGPMTVTEDGNFVVTDPGVGLLQPGWHGTSPGSGGGGDNLGDDDDGDDDDGDDDDDNGCEEEGAACDDGDPCTKDDKCTGGSCAGTPVSGAACGAAGAAPIDKSEWTLTEDDSDAGGNYTSHQGFTIEGGVCLDSAAQAWRYQVSKLKWKGKINITLKFSDGTFSIEPNPADGGNVTQANYCSIITELAGYLGRGRGSYHLKSASRAHEVHHRDVDWPKILDGVWPALETALEAETVPCDKPEGEAQTILSQKAQATAATLETKFTTGVGTFNTGHDSARNDAAYQAGQDVLNGMITQIKNYAQGKGWPACPGSAPHLVSGPARRLTLQQEGGLPLRYERIDASVPQDLIGVNQTVQITVLGVSDTGSTDLTRASSGTAYQSTAPGIATVSPDGLVTARGPGVATILIQHSAGRDIQPLNASVRITVRSNFDADNDGMPDDWERAVRLNPNNPADAFLDADGDRLMNIREYELGTDPTRADTDGDGVSDFEEILQGQSPLTSRKRTFNTSLGLHYFVLLNLDTGEVQQRGITGRNGIGHANLIMAPNARYRQWILRARDLNVGTASWVSAGNGQRFVLPAIVLKRDLSPDTDGDGLTDIAEFILGTDTANPDTDNDGIPDGAEAQQGSNANDGRPVSTGVLASADTNGNAVDVCAVDGIAAVADSDAGVAIFNIGNGLTPTRLAQIDTAGNATAVACTTRFIIAADGPGGLAVISLANPANPLLTHQLNLGGAVNAVAIAGSVGFAGLADGRVMAVDLMGGRVIDSVSLGNGVNLQDLAISGQTLFVLAVGNLYAVALDEGEMHVVDSEASPGGVGAGRRRLRLFVAEGRAYATFTSGYNVFDVADRTNLRRLFSNNTSQQGWKQIVPNGSGLGLATVSANSTDDGDHDVSLYNLGADGLGTTFVATFQTPGLATAISLFNGLAYVADGAAGLQVINYAAFDNQGVAPSISLSASFPLNPAQAEEGQSVNVTAHVTDDVQVRSVEFFVDGTRIATDNNYGFDVFFTTPLLSSTKNSFTLQARATDTGGNSQTTELITVALVPDATPPRVTRRSPAPDAFASDVALVSASFSEPIQASTVIPATFTLRSAGEDVAFGTADDEMIAGRVDYRSAIQAAVLALDTPLPPGLYEARLKPPIADAAGNPLAGEVAWRFWVLSDQDSDGDGLPDNIEAALGFDPNKPDSNGNGVIDGREDSDGDRLGNAWEVFFGLDPRARDSDSNGLNDDLEDLDNDGLRNLAEFQRGTSPRTGDSDGDGFDDNGEVADGTSPTDPASQPLFLVSSPAASFLNAVADTPPAGTAITSVSAGASYLNALAEVPPTGTSIVTVSSLASYLNALPETPTPATLISASSPLVSYLNALSETPTGVIQIPSPLVSYQNQ